MFASATFKNFRLKTGTYEMPGMLVISQAEACEVLRVSRPTLVRYTRDGMPVISRGKYSAGDIVNWFVKYQCKVAVRDAGFKKTTKKKEKGHRMTADERLVEARAIKIETENGIRNGEILEYNEVTALVADLATTVSNSMEALGPRLAPILAGIDDPATIQKEIRSECHNTSKIIAGKLRKFGLKVEDENS